MQIHHCRGLQLNLYKTNPTQTVYITETDMAADTRKVVYAALVGNVLVAVTKIIAAVLTGSSAMVSEAVHSVVDTGNEVLLLYGGRQSKRSPDQDHPFGYGRELYFWSFIVALLIFAVGAGVSAYEGVQHLLHPEPIDRPVINFVVLGLSLVFEGASWWIALRSVKASKGQRTYWQAITCSKDPPQFMVLVEDSAAIIGILIAVLGTAASVVLHDPRYDGVASLLIAAVLAVVAIVLARESKNLLIGERADPAIQQAVVDTVKHMPGIVGINGIMTSQMSPTEVIAALSVEFDDRLTIVEVETIVADLEQAVCASRPEVMALFIKPQTPKGYAAAKTKHALKRAALEHS